MTSCSRDCICTCGDLIPFYRYLEQPYGLPLSHRSPPATSYSLYRDATLIHVLDSMLLGLREQILTELRFIMEWAAFSFQRSIDPDAPVSSDSGHNTFTVFRSVQGYGIRAPRRLICRIDILCESLIKRILTDVHLRGDQPRYTPIFSALRFGLQDESGYKCPSTGDTHIVLILGT